MARRRAVEERPDGLVYEPELLTEAEERALMDVLERLEFHEIRMHGVVAKRTARHFGLDYDYERRGVIEDAEPIPDWLVPVREGAAQLAGVEPDELAEILVQRYPEGAQIGWHRDAPAFDIVVGVSLGSASRMRFRRDAGGVRKTFELELAPRSGYILAGESRTAWKHHVPPAKELRYSITFRTLRKSRSVGGAGALAPCATIEACETTTSAARASPRSMSSARSSALTSHTGMAWTRASRFEVAAWPSSPT